MVARIALVGVFVMVASAAFAQDVVNSFTRLPEVVHNGNVVMVTDEKGQQTKGKISELSPASLTILNGGYNQPSVFQSDRVMRVSKIDSRLNGFLIGVAAGAVPGILLGMGVATYCNNEAAHCPGAPAYLGGALGLIGGWIGFSIDGAINGQKLVFAR
jgi:hypothetical protein